MYRLGCHQVLEDGVGQLPDHSRSLGSRTRDDDVGVQGLSSEVAASGSAMLHNKHELQRGIEEVVADNSRAARPLTSYC